MNTRIHANHWGARILVGATLLSLGLMGAVRSSHAQCDVPLIAQQVSVAPNVMILLDNSGSMNEVMYHEAYNPDVVYPGDFTTNAMYYVGGDMVYTTNGRSAQLIVGLHGQWGRYAGNYLNWVYWVATDQQRANIPTVTRQMVANTAVKAIINQANGLRYGLARFNNNDGGQIVAPCGTTIPDLENIVDNMVADTWTPTAETMMDILRYFKDPSGPIQYECQKNFVIVVTDGYPTQDLNVPSWIGDQDGDGREPGDCEQIGLPPGSNGQNCSDYLDDVAYYLAHNDMRSDLTGEQNVSVYTIGFGVDAPLLNEAAVNGDGLYRVAWDLNTLIQELGTVLGDIVNRISSGAAVAVVSTETGSDSHLYRGKFMPGMWQGFMEAYSLPYSPASSPDWEGGALLQGRQSNTRDIFTSLSGSKISFSANNAAALMPYLGSASTAEAGDLINYIRGDAIPGMRDRNGWKLGDLVYSTPVVVGPPSQFYLTTSYQSFLAANQNRPNVVYVGANDGMLHAFDALSGEEIWSYIPQEVLWKLNMLADPNYCHQAYVDLSPAAYDVNINGTWKTVLFGGERSGGNSYFALDITNPHSPDVLWETSVPSILSSYSEPELINSQWGPLLWAGSGPDPAGGAHVVGLRVDTGAVLFAGTLSTMSGTNLMSGAAPIDIDWDGVHDYIYQGDLEGNLWRFDLTQASGITADIVFSGGGPIQARPALTITPNGDPAIYFGTGRYLDVNDITNTSQQWLYGIIDDLTGAYYTPSDLVDQTNTINSMTGNVGWMLRLDNAAGERIIQPAVVVEGVVYATSFAPSSAPCLAGGESWLWAVDYINADVVQPQDGSNVTLGDRSSSLGAGVASRPVINLAGEEVIVQTSDARLNIQQLSISPQRINVRAWRERFSVDPAVSVTGQ